MKKFLTCLLIIMTASTIFIPIKGIEEIPSPARHPTEVVVSAVAITGASLYATYLSVYFLEKTQQQRICMAVLPALTFFASLWALKKAYSKITGFVGLFQGEVGR